MLDLLSSAEKAGSIFRACIDTGIGNLGGFAAAAGTCTLGIVVLAATAGVLGSFPSVVTGFLAVDVLICAVAVFGVFTGVHAGITTPGGGHRESAKGEGAEEGEW